MGKKKHQNLTKNKLDDISKKSSTPIDWSLIIQVISENSSNQFFSDGCLLNEYQKWQLIYLSE